MSCFYRNQKVTITRRQDNGIVTTIYNDASTVTIEDYKGSSFLMIQCTDKNKKPCSVRYNCADIISFILTPNPLTKKFIPESEPEKETEESPNFTENEEFGEM